MLQKSISFSYCCLHSEIVLFQQYLPRLFLQLAILAWIPGVLCYHDEQLLLLSFCTLTCTLPLC